jgi:hypothetical protein
MQWIIRLNPMYYMNLLFTKALYLPVPDAVASGPGPVIAAAVTMITLSVLTFYSIKVAKT